MQQPTSIEEQYQKLKDQNRRLTNTIQETYTILDGLPTAKDVKELIVSLKDTLADCAGPTEQPKEDIQ